jgi:hypothetical protein
MRRSLTLVLAVAAALSIAVPARAGTYEVRACATALGNYPNRSWTFAVPSGNWSTATTCAGSRPELTLLMLGDTATPALQAATMYFRPPAGALIRDFTLTRQVYYYNPTRDSGTAPPYILYGWGGYAFAGAGEYDAVTREAINATGHWYGYPSGAADTGAQVVTKATFPRLAGTGDAASLTVDVGCWGTPCSLAASANVFTTLYGARVTVVDESRPAVSADPGSGLYGGGSHGGDEGVRFSASDNVGVRRAELLDLTDPNSPKAVGRKDNGCDFARARPCGNFSGSSVAPSQRLPSGTRTLAVRVTDTAGNQATTEPRGALVGGPLNGTNASATGRLRAVFTKGGKTRRTVEAGGRPSVSLWLRDAGKRPIGDARIQVRSRQLRTGARSSLVRELRTGARGRVRFVVPKGTSRELRFEYRTRVDDQSPALSARVRLGVRPRATLTVRPKRVRFGGTIRLSGRVRSRPRPRPGKLIVLQAFDNGRWRTFATTRSGKGGRYARRYRFSRTFRPRTYRFRARLPREGAYPYSTGNSRTVRVRVG